MFPLQVQFSRFVDSIIDVPCFRCLLRKTVSPYNCDPEHCLYLELWVQELAKDSPRIVDRFAVIST